MVQPLQASNSVTTVENGDILTEKSQETSPSFVREETNSEEYNYGTVPSNVGSSHIETSDSSNTDGEISSVLKTANLHDDKHILQDKSKDSSSVSLTTKLDSIITSSANNINTNGIRGSQIAIPSYKDSCVTKPNVKITSTSKVESLRSESKTSKHTTLRMYSSRSCRSELDLASISEANREKLLDAFLPDIRRVHARMSFEHRTRPFNLNHEGLKNVQIRAKTAAGEQRFLREHRDETLGRGRKAASNITPRPAWVVKDVSINAVHERLFPGEGPTMYAYVKRQQWDYIDRRPGMKRVLPKRSHTK